MFSINTVQFTGEDGKLTGLDTVEVEQVIDENGMRFEAVEGTERLRAVRAKRVQECVQRLLVPEHRVVGWCRPRPQPAPGRPTRKRARHA